MFPLLAKVARGILALPPSAAVLERDFSIVAQCLTRDRASTDPALIEMTMFLHSLPPDQVPVFIPEIEERDFEDSAGKKLLPQFLFEERFQLLCSSSVSPDTDYSIGAAQEAFDKDPDSEEGAEHE